MRKLVFIAHLLLATAIIAPAAAETYKMTTPIAPGVVTPDEVGTSIGTLKLHDGVPSVETTETIYDRSGPMKLYTLYAPPNHRDGVVQATKAGAEADKEHFDGKTTE